MLSVYCADVELLFALTKKKGGGGELESQQASNDCGAEQSARRQGDTRCVNQHAPLLCVPPRSKEARALMRGM